jgi:hypothetical protein
MASVLFSSIEEWTSQIQDIFINPWIYLILGTVQRVSVTVVLLYWLPYVISN